MMLNRERAYAVMDKHRLVGLVARDHINVFYLTDHWSTRNEAGSKFGTFAILPRAENAPAGIVVSAPSLERLVEAIPTWVPNVVPYSDYSGRVRVDRGAFDPMKEEPAGAPWKGWPVRPDAPLTSLEQKWVDQVNRHGNNMAASPAWGLKRALREAGMTRGRIGTDDPQILSWMQQMGCPDIEIIEATNIFREIRMVKTPEEIRRLRRAAEINEAATDAVVASLREGAVWEDAVATFNLEMTKAGGRPRFLTTSGGLPHGHVVPGRPMHFDALGEYQHYLGDFGRIVVVGEPSPEVKRRAHAMEEGVRAGLALLKPGVKRRAIIDAVLAATQKAGFPEYFYASPHSLGLEHTDNPQPMGPNLFEERHDLEFVENMVLNIDMPYFEHGWGTLHLEDTVLVTRNGFEPLTSLNSALRIAG